MWLMVMVLTSTSGGHPQPRRLCGGPVVKDSGEDASAGGQACLSSVGLTVSAVILAGFRLS